MTIERLLLNPATEKLIVETVVNAGKEFLSTASKDAVRSTASTGLGLAAVEAANRFFGSNPSSPSVPSKSYSDHKDLNSEPSAHRQP